MLQTLGDDAKRERLHSRDGFVTIAAVTHDAGQIGHFGDPAPIRLPIDLYRVRHGANVLRPRPVCDVES